MLFIALTTVLLLIVCGAVFVSYGPLQIDGSRLRDRAASARSPRAWGAGLFALLPLAFWAYVWLFSPRWSLAWELASIVQAMLVMVNAIFALRAGDGWPSATRITVRVVAIFTAALFLGLLANSLLETLPTLFSGQDSAR